MSTREVTVPALILVPAMDPDGEPREHLFSDFVCKGLLTDMRLGQGYEMVMLAIELHKAFEGSKPGDKIRIRPPAWEMLCKIVEKPQFQGGGFHPWAARFLVPYMDAIKEAVKIEDGELKSKKEG